MKVLLPVTKLFRLSAGSLGLIALVTQLVINTIYTPADRLLFITTNFFSYFTIIINIIVATSMLAPIFAPFSRVGQLFTQNHIRAGVTLYIVIVWFVYHFALSHLYSPEGIRYFTDLTFHYIVPLLTAFDWLFLSDKRNILLKHVTHWLVLPFAYGIYTLIRGYFTGFYPYPFMNVDTQGALQVTINLTVMFIGFGILGVLMVFGARLVARRRYSEEPA